MCTKLFKSALILIGSLALIILWKTAVPRLIRNQVATRIEKQCLDCKFSLETAQLQLFPLKAQLHRIRFVSGNSKATLFEVEAEKITIEFSLIPLFTQTLKIGQIDLKNARVNVTEGDLKSPESKKEGPSADWNFEIDQIKISNAVFNYNSLHRGKTASIHVNEINGGVGKFGTTRTLRGSPTEAHVSALLERSGKIDLSVSSHLFSEILQIEVELRIDDFNLAKISPYFMNTAGIELGGFLSQCEASANIEGDRLKAKIRTEYRQLKVEFNKTSERGILATTLSNLFSGIKSKNKKTREVTIQRKSKEPLVGFTFRGLMLAAIKTVTD